MRRRRFFGAVATCALCAPRLAAAAHPAPAAVRLEGRMLELLPRTVARLRRVQRHVGFGNFNLLGFDDALRLARRSGAIGRFSMGEVRFLEEIFFADAARYGFFGQKVFADITTRVPRKEVIKVPRSGHYLYRGPSLALYRKLRADIGASLVLTSGVRGMAKQMYLFLSKAVETGGDLSTASRSLAPPGHSFHGVGDFDVGRSGLGHRNFTTAFADTDEYRRLADLGYASIRYPEDNPFGVRFEPWHIRMS